MPLVRSDATPPHARPGAPADHELLVAGDTDQRWSAARALGARPGDLEALAAALAREGDPRVREAILTSLARMGGREAAAAILPHLRSDDAALRTGALDALCAMPRAKEGLLAELLLDRDPDVRLLACELARHMPEAAGEDLLCSLLERETEVNVCAAAVEMLAEIGTAAALPSLARCAERFVDAAFLSFSVRVAAERIAKTPSGG